MNRRFLEVNLRVIGTANDSNSTTDGDQFIVGASPAGNFAGAKKNDLAQRVDGAWVFYTPWYDNIEIMNIESGKWERFNGTAWESFASLGGEEVDLSRHPDPVEAVTLTGTALPATAAVGDTFLDMTTGDFHVATALNVWDAGTATAEGSRYASATDAKLYVKKSGVFVGEVLADGAIFLEKLKDNLYCYDGKTSSFARVGGDATIADASYTEKGKVVIAKTGGLKIVDGSVALGRAMVTQKIVLNAEMASSKEVVLAKHVVAGLENDVTLSACGVMQVPDDDFKIVEFEESGTKKSRLYWGWLGLDEIGLIAGDVIVVSYQTDAV